MTRIALLFVLALSACSALGQASAPLDAYTLQPLPAVQGPSGSRHLVVELPTASGALTTDRILIKPTPLQAQYLPKGRWVDPVPELVQTLLVASLQNAGGFRLVGRDGAGMTPDFVALVEVNDFQAEAPDPATHQTPVHVGLTLTLLNETDRHLIGSRRFDGTAMSANSKTLTVVSAFDAATRQVLTDAVTWVNRTAR
jgi:cholesterol transport system auxiliary component